MIRPRGILTCFAILAALVLCGPAAALASSAGDQQYTDPLAPTSTGPTHTNSGSPQSSPGNSSPSGSSSAGAQSAGAQPSGAQSPGSTTANGSSSSGSPSGSSSAATLPRTGFAAYLSAALGLLLLAAGLAIRRISRSA